MLQHRNIAGSAAAVVAAGVSFVLMGQAFTWLRASSPAHVSVVFFANAFGACFLVLSPRRLRPFMLASMSFCYLAWPYPLPLIERLIYCFWAVSMVLLGALACESTLKAARGGEGFSALAKFIGLALLVPGPGAFLLFVERCSSFPFYELAWSIITKWISESLAFIAVVPLVYGISLQYQFGRLQRLSTDKTLIVAGSIAAEGLALRNDGLSLLYLAFPITFCLTAYLEFFGAAISVFSLALMLTFVTQTGSGPAEIAALSPLGGGLYVQAFLAVLSTTSLMVGTALQQRRALQRALHRAALAAETSAKAKEASISNLSHEIRSPLASIILSASTISKDSTLASAHRQTAANLSQSSEMILGILDDILMMSRLEAGMVRVVPKRFSLRPTLESAIAVVHSQAAMRQVDLVIHGEVDLELMYDAKVLRQIVVNLLTNAIRHAPPGTQVAVANEVTLDPDNWSPWFRITVIDVGAGIPIDQQALLFDRFQRVEDDPSTRSGAGLGLAICQGLAKLMGGRLNFESAPGEGSSFWIELPLSEADADPGEYAVA